jgi:aldehyde dehydrogenase (NAD+)
VLIKSCNAALREVGKWMAPEKASLILYFPTMIRSCIYCSLTSEMLPQVWAPLVAFPADAQVVPEPLGVVLIFSCWNFPLGKHFAVNLSSFATSIPFLLPSYSQRQVYHE